MLEVKILIPLRGNDGTEFSDRDHLQFELQLSQLFGGWTREALPVKGGWVDGGTHYQDESYVYIVFLASLTKGDDVLAAVEFAKVHYAQIAITIRYLGGIAEIL